MPSKSRIDKEEFEQMCLEQLSEKEIADYYGLDRRTVNHFCKQNYGMTFTTFWNLKRTKSKAIIINEAFKLAKKNGAVMIFCLKNLCGWKDNPDEQTASNAEIMAQFAQWFGKDDKQTN